MEGVYTLSRAHADFEKLKQAIEIAGGLTQMSRKANVSYQSVLDWKHGRASPSPLNCIKIEKATDGAVNRREILPDFPWEETE